jgi:hypothetical protein
VRFYVVHDGRKNGVLVALGGGGDLGGGRERVGGHEVNGADAGVRVEEGASSGQ